MAAQNLMLDPGRGDSERYSCPFCSKTFVRKAHMLRHQQQHASQKPFHCSFCSKSFKRSDVLRAHQFRCKERGELPVPEGQSKGRKRSSCTSCVKLRTKCDHETPCGRCQELGKECVRESGSARPSDAPRLRIRDAIPIHHLLNTPPGDDFGTRFPIRDAPMDTVDEDDDTELLDPEDSSEASHWSEDYDPYDPYVGADVTFESFFGSLETMTFGQYPMQADSLPQPTPMGTGPAALIYQALEPRAAEVKQALHMTARNFGGFPEAQHMTELGPHINHITGAEVDSLINLYFQHYHRHCPILHRPSFQPTSVPLPLLLSTMALGGMYSPDSAKVQWMRSLLDLMEAYIFSLPGLRDEYNESINLAEATNEDALQAQFELFQGAYLIIIAQYFSGNLAAKRRARRQRFTRVLDIARSFKLPTSQHGAFVAIPDEAAFQGWIRKERRIRQMNIMLAFDAALAIFNNVPPRITFSELDLQLPCDSQYFELSSHHEMVTRSTFPKPKMKLLDAFQKLFVTTPSELRSVFDRRSSSSNDVLNSWDMLLLVHCLYTHVWRQTFSNPLLRVSPSTLHTPGVILEPLKTAIRNWKVIWDDIRAAIPREQLRDMGFETSADSYWTLTKLIVHRFDPKSVGVSNGHRSQQNQNHDQALHDMEEEGAEATTNTITATTAAEGLGSGSGSATTKLEFAGEENSGGSSSAAAGQPAAPVLDFMPLETDCDSQGAHLRKILRRAR